MNFKKNCFAVRAVAGTLCVLMLLSGCSKKNNEQPTDGAETTPVSTETAVPADGIGRDVTVKEVVDNRPKVKDGYTICIDPDMDLLTAVAATVSGKTERLKRI